jgi:heme-degrading monooxygenase HmoA
MTPFLTAVGASLIATGATSQTIPADNSIIVLAPNAVVAVVKVPKPWYAPNSVVIKKMQSTVAQYEQLAGLDYKIFTLTQPDAQFGGIYLWRDQTAAQSWFSPAWHERVVKERGATADVRLFSAPVVVSNAAIATTDVSDANRVATLVTVATPPQISRERLLAEFNAAAPTYQKVPGLIRKYFIITDDGKFGGVYLWDTQASAQQWFNPAWQDRVLKTYGSSANLEWFDAPILTPSKLARHRTHTETGTDKR